MVASSFSFSKGPPPVANMKAMEPAGAPMISVPKGVIKEFVTNSPSPTPLINNEPTTVDSPKVASQDRTPSPDLPNNGNDSALPTDPPNHVVNGVLENNSEKTDTIANSNVNNGVSAVDTPEMSRDSSQQNLPNNDLSGNSEWTSNTTDLNSPVPNTDAAERRLNGTVTPSLKRPSDQSEGPFPDLKKVRVFTDNKISTSTESSTVPVDTTNQTSKPSNCNEDADQDEIMCLSSNVATKPDDKSSENLRPTPSIFDELLPKQEDKKDFKYNPGNLPILTQKSDNDPVWQEKTNFKGKLRTLSRKELEKLIMRLFSEKTLYQCELGRQKQLCEKLETTLEANRKKTAQFHKEIEDLKKVTSRLSSEQAARKGQYVAPIRIKRSVGIQAAPHIINKGLQHAQNSAIKTISPRAGISPSKGHTHTTSGRNLNTLSSVPPGPFPTKIPPKVSNGPVVGILMSNSQPTSRPPQALGSSAIMQGNTSMTSTAIPSGTVTQTTAATFAPGTISTVRPATGPIMMMTQAPPGMIQQTVPRPAVAGRPQSMLPAPGTLVKVPAPTQLAVAINQGGGGVVLLPNTSPGAALVVSQVSGVPTVNNVGNAIVATARSGAPRVMGTSFKPVSTPTASGPPVVSSVPRHPAPLPRTPVQQVAGITKKLPPQPTLKLSHKENSIVLSWTMAKTEDHETIASYQLYAYQEGNTPPSPALWKKVGSVKALELPMACTLTQFMPGHVYHFAVRAVDIKSRLGPFSDPRSIRLEKK